MQTLRCAIRAGAEPREARQQILAAVELVARAEGDAVPDLMRPHTHRLGYSGMIAVGEFRMTAYDLLVASGLDADRAADLVRQTADPADWD
ncbi:hypothetical protein [Micromonospora tarensis]|uniref:Uncharacterized protein n=1 Tax=Micromonospora tarensis TaxID=2806100 RepID=A0ABS1YA36_9ACTN|nr:hypothetical protein [Micromonospora tarensis]MBM0274271.1 hypothetical protein [Micromonospora tarensis]